jgi:hypothetical protein
LSNAPRRTGPQLIIVERVGHETTVFDMLAVRVNCRQSILLGQLDDQSAVHPAFHFVTHIESIGVFLCHPNPTNITKTIVGRGQLAGLQDDRNALINMGPVLHRFVKLSCIFNIRLRSLAASRGRAAAGGPTANPAPVDGNWPLPCRRLNVQGPTRQRLPEAGPSPREVGMNSATGKSAAQRRPFGFGW